MPRKRYADWRAERRPVASRGVLRHVSHRPPGRRLAAQGFQPHVAEGCRSPLRLALATRVIQDRDGRARGGEGRLEEDEPHAASERGPWLAADGHRSSSQAPLRGDGRPPRRWLTGARRSSWPRSAARCTWRAVSDADRAGGSLSSPARRLLLGPERGLHALRLNLWPLAAPRGRRD
jgi:hypothetical protein